MATIEYRILAFKTNADPDDIEEAVNAMASTGWRIVATGGLGQTHVIYFENDGSVEVPEQPVP